MATSVSFSSTWPSKISKVSQKPQQLFAYILQLLLEVHFQVDITSTFPLTVHPGDRIAQLILEKISTPPVVEVDDLSATERGSGGFGSTGKN